MATKGPKDVKSESSRKCIELRLRILECGREYDRLFRKTGGLVAKIEELKKEQAALMIRTGRPEEDAIELISQVGEISKKKKRLIKEAEESLKGCSQAWKKREALERERAPLEKELRRYLKKIENN